MLLKCNYYLISEYWFTAWIWSPYSSKKSYETPYILPVSTRYIKYLGYSRYLGCLSFILLIIPTIYKPFNRLGISLKETLLMTKKLYFDLTGMRVDVTLKTRYFSKKLSNISLWAFEMLGGIIILMLCPIN